MKSPSNLIESLVFRTCSWIDSYSIYHPRYPYEIPIFVISPLYSFCFWDAYPRMVRVFYQKWLRLRLAIRSPLLNLSRFCFKYSSKRAGYWKKYIACLSTWFRGSWFAIFSACRPSQKPPCMNLTEQVLKDHSLSSSHCHCNSSFY